MNDGITVAYSGVHQAYQLALAAHEIGKLDRFYCSFLDARGKWGHRFARLIGSDVFASRRISGLPPEKGEEHPWPLLWHEARARVFRSHSNDWSLTNDRFDSWVAARLARSASRVFIGTETCARDSFCVGKKKGMICILDAPQVASKFLIRILQEGYERAGLRFSGEIDNQELAARKQRELELADFVLVYSDVHRRSFCEAGVAPERLVQIPLWADPELWDQPHGYPDQLNRPLKVLFVGGVRVRKGVPWLLDAAKRLGKRIDLTLVGPVKDDFVPLLQKYKGFFKNVGAQTKMDLATLYRKADILVLPSLVDSFGFVAMEAMLSGLPVIASQNCGVPLPDDKWRVPIMNGEAIARRLEYYAEDPETLKRDGEIAVQFARQFTPERYRDQIKDFFRRILGEAPVVVADVKSCTH